jgi:hypothetical protein
VNPGKASQAVLSSGLGENLSSKERAMQGYNQKTNPFSSSVCLFGTECRTK